jgi:outer membrane usher protein
VATFQWAARPKFPQLLSRCACGLLLTLAALAPLPAPAADPAASPVEFDPAFLRGGAQVDVSQFSRGNPVLPGDYLIDVWINQKWSGRASVRFIAQPGSNIARPCIDQALIARIGLDFEKLPPGARTELQKLQSSGCANLTAILPDATVAFDLPQLRLDITVPQAALVRKPRGYVDPAFWDRGVPSATLAYNLNAYRSATSLVTSSDAHADLTAGLNLGSWHLRQRSSVELTSGQGASYQNIATYLAHDIPSIRSDLILGESATDGAVFDSFDFRGVSLASDDQMLPDSQLQYAPLVRGIARTNARVVITQNGNIILETTVSPGSFEINDLYPTGYGGDLKVTVYEADGSEQSFTVPYASVVQLLRPGVWRYSSVAGQVQQPTLTTREPFTQATLQHGFSNTLTAYTGATLAEHYAAGLLGIAVNTVVGAMASDVTQARAELSHSAAVSGTSLRFTYSKLLPYTHTNITLATYRYSSSGYYSFSDALTARDATLLSSAPEAIAHARSRWQVNINQTFPDQWGSFFLTGSTVTYWNTPGTTTLFQAGYGNHARLWGTTLSYSASLARQRNELTGQPDNQVLVNFSLLLGHSPHSPSLALSAIRERSGGMTSRSGQAVLTGTLGQNNQLTYNASASQSAGDQAYTGNVQYRTAYSSLSAGAGAGSGYSQQSFGATGGVVAHPGGVTLSNQLTDTVGIVQAIGAQGARVTNNVGTVIDRSGYAVLPFLLPYRLNTVTVDPEGALSSDVEFKNTTESVAPRVNAVVMIRFDTVSGRPVLATAHREDGSLVPFGASVYDAKESEVGLVGQDGRIYLRGIADAGTLTVRWGEASGERCVFPYRLPAQQQRDEAFVRIEVTCAAARVTGVGASEGSAAPNGTGGQP